MTSRTASLLGLGLALFVGCADELPGAATIDESHVAQPIGVQIIQAVPELKGQRFTNLLHFEQKSDVVFVSTWQLQSSLDTTRAHTGQTSLALAGNHGKLTVKLGSLLTNQSFPTDWTLGGAYFYADKPAQITVTCETGGKAVAQNRIGLPANQWAAALVDLTSIPTTARSMGTPALSFAIECPGRVWCDDVLLIDNTQPIVEGKRWSIQRRGFSYVCDAPGRFSIRLASAEALPTGWQVEEANDLRARFSSTGQERMLTIYPDGRSYWDGRFKPLSAEARSESLYAQQSQSPAEIRVPETMGRVERRSAGDENNDGYNECRATYMLVATGPRLDVTIVPQSLEVASPALEISGLPSGKVVATLEGRLIETTARLDDGTVLLEIPTKISRATVVNVHVQ